MGNTLSSSRRSHSRRLAPQVQRPRLRPSWRIALTIVAAAAALTATLMLVDRVGRAIGVALADRDWPEIRREADRLIAEQRLKDQQLRDQRAQPTYFDPELCKLKYGVDVAVCDEATYRRLGDERAARERPAEQARLREERVAKARAAGKTRHAAESRPSAQPADGPGNAARSPARR